MRLLCLLIAAMCTGCAVARNAPEAPIVSDIAVAAPEAVTCEQGDPEEQERLVQQHTQRDAVAVAFEPMAANVIAAINERNHTNYSRDFARPWALTNRDAERFYRMADDMHERLGVLYDPQISEISRQGSYYVLDYSVQCSKAGDPLVIRFVAKYYGDVLKIVFHSLAHS